jgi:glycosyltransferase involved in cell wall biosynthesis
MRVLIVTSRFPLPARRGNQVRTLEWLRALAAEQVALVCPRPGQPDDLQGLNRDRLALWTHGSGVPMKVLEAWAAGLPVVAHPWSAAGLPADARDALAVADGADEWHRTVTRLVTDPSAAAGLAERGRELWRRSYHPERVDEALRAALAAAI